jgi:dTMP kinase
LFIVFEGIDGSGTTTQCGLLSKYIESQGHRVVVTREPGGTILGEKLRALLLGPSEEICYPAEMMLYAASRAQHVHQVIGPALSAGTPVVCDRFVASSLAYQGCGRGLGLEVVRIVNEYVIGDNQPDQTIYLDVPVEIARQRCIQRCQELDRIELAGDRLQEKVQKAYREIASQQGETAWILDGTRNCDSLAEEIRSLLLTRWPYFPYRDNSGEVGIHE